MTKQEWIYTLEEIICGLESEIRIAKESCKQTIDDSNVKSSINYVLDCASIGVDMEDINILKF